MQAARAARPVVCHGVVVEHGIFYEYTSAVAFCVVVCHHGVVACAENHVHAAAVALIRVVGVVEHEAVYHAAVVAVAVNARPTACVVVRVDVVFGDNAVPQRYAAEYAYARAAVAVGLVVGVEPVAYCEPVPSGTRVFHVCARIILIFARGFVLPAVFV